MDFPDVANMFVSRMVISCFGCVLLVCSICDRSAFMLIGIHFGDVFGLVDFTSKGGKVCFIFWKYVLSLARLALSLSEAGSAWCRKAMSLIFSSTIVDFI